MVRIKWLGLFTLFIDLILATVRQRVGATASSDVIILILLAFGFLMIIIDCRVDDKKYVESIKKRCKGGNHHG